ncbi:hypothetical protein LNP27_15045 [Flavobacterium galactosidilyticum]|uniref:hypothetical protein n=1 Tax=Flavobacterium galactosidilyticum TaxID=2893886 RepID=UPI001E583A18|nr:hypothetical protein [Flavobacterium sp. F-340]UFH46420.1 hypothetical protein LNP27_15045 [Flavobacterium sp. F-340]
MKNLKNIFITLLLLSSIYSKGQTKYFNTFTLIVDGQGKDVKDNIYLDYSNNKLSLKCNTFNFKNAIKTGKKETYIDSKNEEILATQYKTNYYEVILMRNIEHPEFVYLKIIDIIDNQTYLIHLHNK